ncbi:MAG: flagellar biosynthesis protein FliQ [bacterium]|nr:flagellar biosynthesis protein FliQ [bacterium]
MLEADVIWLIQEALLVTLKIAAPILILSMIVGLFISILQTTTSIQEQTLTFVPKLVAVFLAIAFFFAYMLNTMMDYTIRVYDLIKEF